MDATTFQQELQLQIIGAGLAGVVTIGLGIAAVAIDRWRQEVNALNALLSFMGKRRALSRPSSLKRQFFPHSADVNRCLKSVLNIRDEAQRARNATRSRSRQNNELDDLMRTCNVFADRLQSDRRDYRQLLAELQHLLDDIAKNIARKGRGVHYVSPGGEAL